MLPDLTSLFANFETFYQAIVAAFTTLVQALLGGFGLS